MKNRFSVNNNYKNIPYSSTHAKVETAEFQNFKELETLGEGITVKWTDNIVDFGLTFLACCDSGVFAGVSGITSEITDFSEGNF